MSGSLLICSGIISLIGQLPRLLEFWSARFGIMHCQKQLPGTESSINLQRRSVLDVGVRFFEILNIYCR